MAKTRPASPVTDYFGSRLDSRALTAGLRARGLGRFQLRLDDRGWTLELPRAPRSAEDEATAWLRGRLSPLEPLRLSRRARAPRGGRFVDARRSVAARVSLVETGPGEGEASAERRARRRLGKGTGAPLRLAWTRAEGDGGRAARFLAVSRSRAALDWLAGELEGRSPPPPRGGVLVEGLEWAVGRRPVVAAAGPGRGPVFVEASFCDGCGDCARVCPASCLGERGRFRRGREKDCLACFDCVEACPRDALRPRVSASSATTSRALADRPAWLCRLAGRMGRPLPAPFPPSYLRPASASDSGPVLGLAVTTLQEHAAALVESGREPAAVEEERFSRVRHHGWSPPGRPGASLASDPRLCLEEALCLRAAGALLRERGLTLDDARLIAVNGLPARYRRAYDPLDARRDIPVLRAGRVVFLPHHLCHAASAWRASGFEDAWVMTVDGRGDRETAAVFRGRAGRLERVFELLSYGDRSIGGVYETVTRALGFGSHGQGSVMALAALGRPRLDFSRALSSPAPGRFVISEREAARLCRRLARAPGAPLTQAHRDAAASLQSALEEVLLAVLAAAGVPGNAPGLCLAGGVALNGRANERIRRALSPRRFFIQPAANDAGTALGAALEAAAREGLPAAVPMRLARLGPGIEEEEARAALERAELDYRRAPDLPGEVARLLATGGVAAWCQGRAEFGPRALGGRSLLADPRRAETKARLNALKGREPWRPFGPSLLAERAGEWFLGAPVSPFMLLTPALAPGAAGRAPAIAHADGTSRPQGVDADADPVYRALLEAFDALTGAPLLLNTSFNRRDEPMPLTAEDAVECFLGMPGVDALALGPFLATRAPGAGAPEGAALGGFPRNRHLMLRLTAGGRRGWAHAPLLELEGRPDRSFEQALRALARGRLAGCGELTILRGEAASWPGLPELLARARAMGYERVVLQTDGHALAGPLGGALLAAVDAFEVELFSAEETRHDALAGGRAGALRLALAGLRAATRAGRETTVLVPLLRDNLNSLSKLCALASALPVARVVFSYPRPPLGPEGARVAAFAPLARAAEAAREGLKSAASVGVRASTEAVPDCLLPEAERARPGDWARVRVDDLDRLRAAVEPGRATERPSPPPCRACRRAEACGRTWAAALALWGASELRPIL